MKQIELPLYNPALRQRNSHHFCTKQRRNSELIARSCPKKYYCPAPRARPEGGESKPEETRTGRRKRRLDRHRTRACAGLEELLAATTGWAPTREHQPWLPPGTRRASCHQREWYKRERTLLAKHRSRHAYTDAGFSVLTPSAALYRNSRALSEMR